MVREFTGRAEFEAASLGPARYARAYAEGRWQVPAGEGWVVFRGSAGAATRDLPAHRAFVLGGRGTLVGEGFRALSGREAVWLSADLRIPVGVPEIPLGSLAGTGRTATLVPFVAAGWTGGAVAGTLGAPARGVRPVIGLGLEWPHDLLRLDVGVSPRTGRVGVAVDVSRAFWDIL
jgi:hemolysin activation/secretion protein